ncbi:hypothetical protein KI387_035945, partial [Taxus chinensis]
IRLGHLGRKDVKDVKRRSGRKEGQGSPFRAVRKNLSQTVRDSWNKGTHGTRKAEGAESQSNLATCLQCKGGHGSPNWAVRRNLSQEVWNIRDAKTQADNKSEWTHVFVDRKKLKER